MTGRGVLRRLQNVPAIRTLKPQSAGLRTFPLTYVGRPRALLAHALVDESGYGDYRERCRTLATSIGFEGSHEVGPGDAVMAVAP